MSYKGPSIMENYQIPTSTVSSDHPGEGLSGDSTIECRDYRAKSVEYISSRDSGGGTVVGYVSTAFRSDVSQGVPDVEFDDKQAYETIDHFQDRRHITGKDQKLKIDQQHPVPCKQEQLEPGMFTMPDYVTKKGWVSLRRCLCFFIILTFVTLFVAAAGAAIGVYAFLLAYDGGRIVGGSSAEIGSEPSADTMVEILQEQLAETNAIINELKYNLSRLTDDHKANYGALSSQLDVLTSVQTNNNDTNPTTVSSYSDCQTNSVNCFLEPGSLIGNTVRFSSCETPTLLSEQPGMVTLDTYCAIANQNGETNPISSNLNFYDGEVSCACYLIMAQTVGFNNIECTLYVKRCPA